MHPLPGSPFPFFGRHSLPMHDRQHAFPTSLPCCKHMHQRVLAGLGSLKTHQWLAIYPEILISETQNNRHTCCSETLPSS